MTKIEWADSTINPVIGCSRVSPGCQNCYAEKMAWRLANNPVIPHGLRHQYRCVVTKDGWTGSTQFRPDELLKPERWKNPRKIFVCSMSDLFHESAYPKMVLNVLTMAEKSPRHTFILLTKRPENALKIFGNYGLLPEFNGMTGSGERIPGNIWFGVTAENQDEYNRRVPLLMQIPSAVHFVSVEPMLEEIRMSPPCQRCTSPTCKSCREKSMSPNWVICGAEQGPKARPMNMDWAIRLSNQCKAAGIPFFFKKNSHGVVVTGAPREFPK